MRKLFSASVLFVCFQPMVQADEAWQFVFEDASVSVAIDSANIRRENQVAIFRERQVLIKPELDQSSLRHVREIQYRRQAHCGQKTLSELSRAVFSDEGALIHYQARNPAQAKGEAAQSGREVKLIEAVCGPA